MINPENSGMWDFQKIVEYFVLMNNYRLIIISQRRPQKHTNSTSDGTVELKIMDLFRKRPVN